MECTVTLGLDTEDDVVHKPTQYINNGLVFVCGNVTSLHL